MSNESDARVMRELLLSVCFDLHAARHEVNHAARTMRRVSDLASRMGCSTEETPIADLLDVAALALGKAARMVDLGLDTGVVLLREPADMVATFLDDAGEVV